MAKAMECPFFKWEISQKLHCEAGVLDFKDKQSRTDYINGYCANIDGCKHCTLYRNLIRKYEREDGKNGT